MTRRTILIFAALMAAVGLTFGLATNAYAFPGISYSGACSGCHTGSAPAPVATLVSNNGTTATYTVTLGGTEWALFNGSARVTGAVGSTGQFTVPVPGTYTLFAVAGDVNGSDNQGLGTAQVAVTAPLSHFNITATAGPNGAISPSGSLSATQGTNVAYSFTANSGYHVATVTVDGVSIGGVTAYTFTNVQAAHTIDVQFAPGDGSLYTITATAGANGSIGPIGDCQVTAGGSIVFTMEPAEGYQVATITVDGSALPTVSIAGSPTRTSGWYTFLNVVKSHTIDVQFKPNPAGWFTVTPYAGAHGTIWMPAMTVQAATTTIPIAVVPCSIMPDAGYHISSMNVDGLPVLPATSYIFYNVRAGHTIAATFAIDNFAMTLDAGAHGAIAGPSAADYGTDAAYSITADLGYHVVDVSVDGVSQGAVSSCSFTEVKAAHTVSATFAIDTFAITKNAGLHGAITGPSSADYGTDAAFTITPDTGYHVVDVTLDGVSQGAVASCGLTSVKATHTVAATFAVDTFSMTKVAGLHGAINGPGTADFGSDAVYSIVPDADYRVADVQVDGVSVGAVTSYKFSSVSAAHTIVATFVTGAPLATRLTLSASASSLKRGQYVGLTATLSGGVPAGTMVRFEYKKPHSSTYVLLYQRAVNASGVATLRYKMTTSGTCYFRVRFMGTSGFAAAASGSRKVLVK